MQVDELGAHERVLVVTAHPDDVDFGAAGTVARLVDGGASVAYCIVTDGQAGGFDRDADRTAIGSLRRDEQRAAAAALGVAEVAFLGHMDGEVTVTPGLRRDIARVIRQQRPDLVITMTPERNWSRIGISHPDHLAVGEATLFAVYPDARNPFAFPELVTDEGLEPHVVGEVWLIGAEHPDHIVDITDVWDRKLAAIRCHVSQLADPDALAERVVTWFSGIAEEAGLAGGRLAEGFRRVTSG